MTELSALNIAASFGLIKDPQDSRDYDLEHAIGRRFSRHLGLITDETRFDFPKTVSWRSQCGPVRDQGLLNTCTACAAAALMDLLQSHFHQRTLIGSRMFIYKVTRGLLQFAGDSGAYLRTTAGALTIFGVPPERFWPYDSALLDTEPSPFCYAIAQKYRSSN